jgi:hypothetical protein
MYYFFNHKNSFSEETNFLVFLQITLSISQIFYIYLVGRYKMLHVRLLKIQKLYENLGYRKRRL